MGGPGSGNRSLRLAKKSTVESGLSLDANRWTREGILKAGVHLSGSWRWAYRSGQGFSVAYDVNTLDLQQPFVRLSYSWTLSRSGEPPQAESYAILLTTTRPRFGGLRWWFVCPLVVRGRVCNRRVGKLYLTPHGRYFGCRHCYDLTYTSCQESGKGRWFYARMAAEMGCSPQKVKRLMRRRREKRAARQTAETRSDP